MRSVSIAEVGALTALAFASASFPAAAGQNPGSSAVSNGSTPALSLLLNQKSSPEKIAGQRVQIPPFVSSANRVSIEIEFDAGAVARKMGGPVVITHPVPLTNEYRRFKIEGSFEGKPLKIVRKNELHNRPFFIANANENSGKIKIVVTGIQLERVIGPNDK